MKQIAFIACIVVLFACRDKEQEVIDINDVIPSSENYKNGHDAEDTSEQNLPVFSPSIDPSLLVEHQLVLDGIQASDSLFFPDRFAPKNTEKFSYQSDNSTVYYNRWSFRDSIKTTNAFLNWMNCFGSTCVSANLGEAKNLQKEPFLLLVSDTSVVYITGGNSAELSKWNKLYTTKKDARFDYILKQSPRGKVSWTSSEDGEVHPFDLSNQINK